MLDGMKQASWAGLMLASACATDNGGEETGKANGTEVRPDGGGMVSEGKVGEQEWRAATAPRTGEHEVWTRGCDAERIGERYRVVPNVRCDLASDYDFESNPRRDCRLDGYCEGPSDCTEEAGGRCEGVPGDGACQYASVEFESCERDSDCDALPEGQCFEGLSSEWLCYPTGECTPPGPYCVFGDEPCETDADCQAREDGECLWSIRHTACSYNKCEEDADCGSGERCACSSCVVADCNSDGDCGADQTCQLEMTCGEARGYHCTTPADECAPEDCSCVYREKRWQCLAIRCGR